VLAWLEAEPLERRWFGDDDALRLEGDNVRSALGWSAARDDLEAVGRIAAGLDWSGEHVREGIGWCERALGGPALPAPLQAQVRTVVGVLHVLVLDADSHDHLDRVLAAPDEAAAGVLAVACAWRSAIAAVRAAAAADPALVPAPRQLADRAVAVSDTCAPPWQVYCRLVTGMAHASLATAGFDDLAHAEAHYRAAAAVDPGPGFAALRSTIAEYLALFRFLAGDADAARSLARGAPSGDGRWPMFGPNQSAARLLALAATGDVDGARAELARIHDAFVRADATRGRETVCLYGGALAVVVGDWERAARLIAAGRPGMHAGAEAALVYFDARDRARAALGSERARRLRDEGVAMPLDEAVALALA
jgi:hypothetical protein